MKGVPLDAGRHFIEVTASERQPFKKTIAIADGVVTDVNVPPLQRTFVETKEEPTQGTTIVALALTGVGVAGIGVGAIAGGIAINKRGEARDVCGDAAPDQCHNRAGLPIWDDAKTAGNIATVGFIVGATFLAAGAAVWFFGPTERATISAGVTPGGAVLRGRF
jgi:hypothetical protein